MTRFAAGMPLVVLAVVGPVGQADANAAQASVVQEVSARPVPAVAPADLGTPAAYIDRSGRVLPTDEDGDPIDRPSTSSTASLEASLSGPCTPVSGRDNPHRSSTGVAVSGHGWWDRGTCSGDLADVYNCLYEHYSDGYWYQKACSAKKRIRPGGGSSDRTTARRDCNNTLIASWRNHVDVDVVGQADTADKPMRQADVMCQVF